MDAAGKAAQAEARAKKLSPKKEQPKTEPPKPTATVKPAEVAKPEPPKTFGLFDAPAAETPATEEVNEEEEILAEATEDQLVDQDDDELDEAA
jgi:hypothetical protein